jgi:hypothetical protein
VDYSWVRQLAERSNDYEAEKQAAERRRIENERLVSQATVPFVEKLFRLLQAFCEEFNKHCMYPDLRVVMSRALSKKSMGNIDKSSTAVEESAYFAFARRNSMYGIRGMSGSIEFVDEIQVSDVQSSLTMRLDEMTAGAMYKLVARVEGDPLDLTRKYVVWTLGNETMDGPMLNTLCQRYFTEFIKRTDN